MSSTEKKNIEKQIEKHQKKIQEIKEKSEKLNQQFNNINEFEKNIQPLYNMPNTHNTRKKKPYKSSSLSVKKSYVKPDGKTMTPSEQEAKRKHWREAKARSKKISNEKKQKKTQSLPQEDLDDFELNPIMEEEGPIMDIQESQPRYRTPPEIIEINPFQNEIMRFDHDAEKNMFAKIGDGPLENTPTKPKRGGKTRKNKKR